MYTLSARHCGPHASFIKKRSSIGVIDCYLKFFMRARCCCSFSNSGGAALEVVVYYAICGTAQGLMATQITGAPHNTRRTKQLFTVVLTLLLLK